MRVHIIANTHRRDALNAAALLADEAELMGHQPGFETETARALDKSVDGAIPFGDADIVVALGGDGTLIRASHLCADRGTPILGVHFGRLGFVTQITPNHLRDSLLAFVQGKLRIESRAMLQADLHRGERQVTTLHALNEISLHRDSSGSMMTVKVWIDGHQLTTYPADGVLVCTPTGSTAYNLSAGGPLLDPMVEAIVLTAVSPHTLSARPLVLRPTSTIRLRVMSRGDSGLSADGHTRLHMLNHDEISITRSPRVTNLVTWNDGDFLTKLGKRMMWSKGMLGEVD